jgi:hypothetical protein
MAKILTVVLVIAVLIGVVGFYREWFAVSTTPPQSAGASNDVHLQINKDKMRQDAHQAADAARSAAHSTQEKVRDLGDRTSN